MCGMEVAAIDRELRGLQSELESLQGRFDTERFLGASWKDFSDAMTKLVENKGWGLTSVTSGGLFGIGALTTYTVKDLQRLTECKVRINKSSAEINVSWMEDYFDSFNTPVDFQNALSNRMM
jgi:hypothetical protein